MADVTFRTAKEEVEEKPQNIVGEETTQEFVEEYVPYTEDSRNYLSKYFDLGDHLDVFAEELVTIDHYLKRLIDDGELANDMKVIEKKFKEMEKINDIKDETRPVIKIGIIKSYIKHLNEIEGIKFNWRKYR